MKKALYILITITFVCMMILSAHAGGMKYLSPDEFDKYDKLLKEKGHPELKTIVAVYDDSFDPPRIGLKCVNKNKRVFQVYIEGDKIKRINKTSDKIK
jgi:hypothetical protein